MIVFRLFTCTWSMRMKVEEQEMELNASNPRVFMEAQAASKEEVSVFD